jgi:hypothetical protein
VIAIAGQPFELAWPRGKKQVRHVPDFLFRLLDGGGVVTDCRPVARADEDFMYKAAVTAAPSTLRPCPPSCCTSSARHMAVGPRRQRSRTRPAS